MDNVIRSFGGFARQACEALARMPRCPVGEGGPAVDGYDAEALRQTVKSVESDAPFEALVVDVDRALLEMHLAVVGEADEEPLDGKCPEPPSTLRDHLRCFLRRSGAYTEWAGGSPTDPRRLLDIFAKQVGLPEFEVFDLVPVQGAALALPRPVALGGATELVPSGPATRAVIAQVVSDAVFFADGVIPAVVGDFDLVVRRSRLKPARLHQDVGGVDGWLLALDFGGHLRRFPRGHGDDMERVLDAVRLFDWSRFGTIGMADGHYSPPDLSARFRAHDALIYRPFHWQSVQRLSGVDDAYDSDGSGVGTRRIDHLILDAAASTDLCDFLTAVCAHRDRVGGVREWPSSIVRSATCEGRKPRKDIASSST